MCGTHEPRELQAGTNIAGQVQKKSRGVNGSAVPRAMGHESTDQDWQRNRPAEVVVRSSN
jgi:hypothetical protein